MDNNMSYIEVNGWGFYFTAVSDRPYMVSLNRSVSDWEENEEVDMEWRNLEFTGGLDREMEETNFEADCLEIELSF